MPEASDWRQTGRISPTRQTQSHSSTPKSAPRATSMQQLTEDQTDATGADVIKSSVATDDLSPLPEAAEPPEVREARDLARRYRLPYVNLLPQDGDSPIDYSLLSEVPVDLMVRNQFVPLKRE